MKELSPSMLPKLDECPLFVGKEGSSEAAQRGTRIDAVIRRVIEQGEDIPADEDYEAIAYGVNMLRELGDNYVETRESHLAMAVPGLSRLGTADAVCPGRRWVADIKTGQARDYRAQLAAYALACMDHYQADEWTTHTIYVDQKTTRTERYTYEEATRLVGDLIAKSTDDWASPRLCEYCDWCANKPNCTAIVTQSRLALETARSEQSLDDIKAEIYATDESLSEFVRRFKFLEKELAEDAITELRSRVEQREVPGWKLVEVRGQETIPASAVVATGATTEQLMSVLGTLKGTQFRDLCAKVGAEIDETTIIRSASIKQLRQSKTKN